MRSRYWSSFLRSRYGWLIVTCVCVTLILVFFDVMSNHRSKLWNSEVRQNGDIYRENKLGAVLISQVENNAQRSEFCKIPKISLYHDTIKHAFHEMDPLICRGKSLFYIRNSILYINNTVLNPELPPQGFVVKEFEQTEGRQKNRQVNKLQSCEYRGIERISDDYYTYTEGMTKIDEPFNLIIKHDFMRIKCVLESNETKEADTENDQVMKNSSPEDPDAREQYYDDPNDSEGYQDGYSSPDFDQFLVQVYPKPEIFARAAQIQTKAEDMNVLIIGLDSLSQLSFRRMFPQTFRYLKDVLNSVVLNAYNIVGDGTTAALIPMFTGMTEMELPEVRRNIGESKYVDVYPMIWNRFRDKGYATMYAEDEPSINTFNLRLNGFSSRPTDHYMRPFWQAIWDSELRETSAKYCTGNVPHHMYMLDYLKDFYVKYPNISKFSFTFITEQTHWNNNPGQYVDEDLYKLLKYFESSGFLDNTLLMVVSDHGARYSAVRNTVQGKLEERLPMVSLRFPVWFQKKYPNEMQNLLDNANKLSSPFDIHETLLDVLDFSRFEKPSVTQTISLNRGISLLQKISSKRTCKSAGIEMHWCSCLSTIRQEVMSEHVLKIAVSVMQFINDMTEPVRQHCRTLLLKKIHSAHLLVPNEKVLKFLRTKDEDNRIANFSKDFRLDSAHYQITVETSPNGGLYEATAVIQAEEIKVFPQISRIDLYGKQPACVQSRYPDLRKYCLCKDFPIKKGG